MMKCFTTTALVLVLCTAGVSFAAESPVQTCLETAADLSPVYPTTSFPAGTKEIIAAVDLSNASSPKKLTSIWIAVEVGAVAPASTQIGKSDLSLSGSTHASFKYSQPKALPAGKYRVDVTGDGKPVGSADFTVADKSSARDEKDPAELLPLAIGRVWTYDFAQESGGDAKIVLEDAAQASDGKFHAEVTQTVAGEDEHGKHMELRRNGKLVFHEWLTQDKRGLSVTQRKADDDKPMALDPSQTIWKLPLKSHTWDYHAKDKSYSQKYLMWGPLPVKAPNGEVPGYIVLCTQKGGSRTLTAERHWAPGVGMVDEIIITAVGDKMVSRQEMTLKSVK
jgi:hypothetical protein